MVDRARHDGGHCPRLGRLFAYGEEQQEQRDGQQGQEPDPQQQLAGLPAFVVRR
jgi:hypothetical protein